jgi:hypothetical protein
MLAQLEVNELIPGLPRTSTDYHDIPVLEFFFPIQGLSRIFKACGHPVPRKKHFPLLTVPLS